MRSQSYCKKYSALSSRSALAFLIISVIFAVLSAIYDYRLALGEALVVLILAVCLRQSKQSRETDTQVYLDDLNRQVDHSARQALINCPLPIVIFRTESDSILWANEPFSHLTGDKEHLFETRLSALIPDFQSQWLLDGDHTSPELVPVGEKRFLVYGHLTSADKEDQLLATTYWLDVTDYASVSDIFQDTRQVLAILHVDNYEDLSRGVDEGHRSLLRTEINNRLEQWLAPAQGFLLRYDRDHYLYSFEAGKLAEFQKRKYSILDEIRQVQSPNGVAATLSIGMSRNAADPAELFESASLALDMALSRGGDQVVIRDGTEFSFVGGRSKETERRTKVKSRVMASALSELLGSTQRVLVMGHVYPDLDVSGAVAGVCAIARKRQVPVRVVRAPAPNPAEEQIRRLAALPEYKGVFITAEEARHLAGPDTIVVVVDTNRPEQTQVPDLLTSGARVIVIDHHRRAASYIQNPALSFHDPYASSACELVTELVQYNLDAGELKREEAEALLAGIVLDTKNFTVRTGSRTFETAAYLRKLGADIAQVNKLFQHDLAQTVSKFEIIQQAALYHDTIAIAKTYKKVGRAIAGQASDEMLRIAGIEASVVLYPEDGQTCLSARSSGNVNVQVLAEMLGGGGNASTAGAQLAGKTPDEALELVKEAIDRYFEEEN